MRFRLVLTVFFWGAGLLSAQSEPSDDLSFGFVGPRIFGADVSLAQGPWKLVMGAGWESYQLGRELDSGVPVVPEGSRSEEPYASDWYPGALVMVIHTWSLPESDLWVSAGAQGYGNFGAGSAHSGVFSDWNGNSLGFAEVGLTRDRREEGPHGVSQGTFVEAFAEWGPGALSVRGTDYYKLSFQSSVRVPLWNLEAPAHLFSGTLALRANVRWIDGEAVPVVLLENTEVRGYHQLLDTRLRSVASAEVRVGLPSLWEDHNLVPVVLVFTEGGWYSGYANAPASVSDRSGWLASVGAAAGMAFFGAVTPTMQVALPLVGDESDLWWKFSFNLKF